MARLQADLERSADDDSTARWMVDARGDNDAGTQVEGLC
jgi:hypothetical protein